MVNGNAEIYIIQGDSYQKNVLVKNANLISIKNIYITCDKFGICKDLEYNEQIGKWVFYLSPEQTSQLTETTTDYDITIQFTDGKVKTVSFEAKFIVFKKTNKVRCLENV